MENRLTKQITIAASDCGRDALLSVPETFALFMDIATDHANALGIGMAELAPRSLFWLTVKTRVRFLRRPHMSEAVTLETWPEPPERIRCNRDYALKRGGETLALGKTEWAVVNTETGKLHGAADIFPAGLKMRQERVWDEPFARLRDDFHGVPVFARYTVRSTDIDLGGHMNNVAYVRALAGAFSSAAWAALDVKELELHFKAPCYEGDTLDIQTRTRGGFTEARMSAAGKTAVLARIG